MVHKQAEFEQGFAYYLMRIVQKSKSTVTFICIAQPKILIF